MMAATSSAAPNRAPTDTVSPYKRRRTISNAEQDIDPLSDCISPLIDPHENEHLPRGAESPRSRVAERLRGLQLFSSTSHDIGEDPMMSNVHDDFSHEGQACFQKQPEDNDLYLASGLDDHTDYMTTTTSSYHEPTPISFRTSRASLSSSFSSSSSSSSPTFLKSSSFPNPSHFRITKPKRRLSSPPPPIQIPAMKFSSAVAGEEEALAVWNGASISWPQQTFGIKNSRGNGMVEFGGNDDDEDDGEGVNGIGYRPTPAVALARRQRRKQQVSEWKAREAREARQKRFVKRRGVGDGGGGRGGGDLGVERVVRFAGVS